MLLAEPVEVYDSLFMLFMLLCIPTMYIRMIVQCLHYCNNIGNMDVLCCLKVICLILYCLLPMLGSML